MDVLLWITAVSGLAWIYLTLFHGWFWRTDVRLAPRARAGDGADVEADAGSVVMIVPARDEAPVLGESLPGLLGQEYPGSARVVLVDDGSTDGTGAVAARLGADPQARVPLSVTSPGEPPAGWTGKVWALRHGVAVAGDPDWILFTDADIAHAPDSLVRLVGEAERDRLDLLSVMARLRTHTRWEQLIVPAFVYFFGKLFPFRRVNRPTSRTAAAAGGCVLVRRTALERAGGVAVIRDAVIDDVSLGTAIKRAGGRIRLVLADGPQRHVDSVRPYPALADLWNMVARSAFAQLRHSWLLLAGTVVGLALIYLAAPVALVAGAVGGDPPLALLGLAVWALMSATYVPMVRYYGRPAVEAVLLPFAATLYLGMTVDSARRHARGRGAAWKGRTYPAPAE
ncbi:glycosyltransferase [Streptomyces sp. SID3343]|uniref:glycosyltransferase n=1 Tax=Streptomyces sp. SID3343 TaxID=2690260 RepID=UPI00136AF96F|nr:glycosyltransferase [Streptomyces sp. SID3343]